MNLPALLVLLMESSRQVQFLMGPQNMIQTMIRLNRCLHHQDILYHQRPCGWSMVEEIDARIEDSTPTAIMRTIQ